VIIEPLNDRWLIIIFTVVLAGFIGIWIIYCRIPAVAECLATGQLTSPQLMFQQGEGIWWYNPEAMFF
jgi:hypothetical protein